MVYSQKWNPSQDLERFRHEVDELLQRFGHQRNWFQEWESLPLRPAMESFVDGRVFTIRIDLPGIELNDVDLTVSSRTLTIRGRREAGAESRTVQYLRRERRYGAFERIIQLPDGVKAEDLKALYKDGVVELTAELSQEAAPREIKIRIQTGKEAGKKTL